MNRITLLYQQTKLTNEHCDHCESSRSNIPNSPCNGCPIADKLKYIGKELSINRKRSERIERVKDRIKTNRFVAQDILMLKEIGVTYEEMEKMSDIPKKRFMELLLFWGVVPLTRGGKKTKALDIDVQEYIECFRFKRMAAHEIAMEFGAEKDVIDKLKMQSKKKTDTTNQRDLGKPKLSITHIEKMIMQGENLSTIASYYDTHHTSVERYLRRYNYFSRHGVKGFRELKAKIGGTL